MKSLKTLSAIALSGIVLSGCASAGTNATAQGAVQSCEGQTLNVARSSSASLIYAVDYVAESQGFFEDEGITIESQALGGGAEAIQALIGGSVDIATVAFFNMLDAREEGAPVISFATQSNRMAMEVGLQEEFAPPAGSDVKTVIESLRGLRVGVTAPGSATEKALRYLLKENGMDPDQDVEIVAVGGAEAIVAAYSQGSLDAFLIGPPNSGIAVNHGGGEIVLNIAGGDIEPLNEMIYMSAVASERTLEQNKPLLQCYANALDEATRFVNENPDEARESVRPYFSDMDQETFDAAWASILPSIPETAIISVEAAENTLGFIDVVSDGTDQPDVSSAITEEFNAGMGE